MVAGKVKSAMKLQKSQATGKPVEPPDASNHSPFSSSTSSSKKQSNSQTRSGTAFPRNFGVYFPRASAQVQPRPPDVAELLRLVDDLRESESKLKTELLEQKLQKESATIVPVLENVISRKDSEIERARKKIECLELENERLRDENEFLHEEMTLQNDKYEEKIRRMQLELADIKRAVEEEASSSSTNVKTVDAVSYRKSGVPLKPSRKCMNLNFDGDLKDEFIGNGVEITPRSLEIPSGTLGMRSNVPRVPNPPPRPSSSSTLSSLSSSSASCFSSSASSPSYGSVQDSESRTSPELPRQPPPPPPPPPLPKTADVSPRPSLSVQKSSKSPPPPPPPPPPRNALNHIPAKVRRVPEVVEFYHSLMRRDTRRDSIGSGCSTAEPPPSAKDMIGEIENRSAHLLAIKSDVETQGDFIRFLIKEVEGAAFSDIEDVVPFVKWLDDELSYLVDERAVLKHFNWPEKKADALREAAFGYCDLKKLESEVSSFQDDPRHLCNHALKKMQSLFEKLEHGVYNLSRMRESASERYKRFHIPTDWMLETGYVSQIKLASVKLAMKYMKRISAELEFVGGGPDEEELIIHGVKFAFRAHQFAGGFDMETMRAFEELRDKARSCNVQYQHHHHHQGKLVFRPSGTCPYTPIM